VVRENLARVEERIGRACLQAGRKRDEITLVAVTKVFPAALIREGWQAGLRDFGENYVQEFEGKFEQVKDLDGARFHLIGHLQSNKSRRAAELFHVIQTVDSPKLARRLNESAKPLEVMIEVKLSPEENKYGASPDAVAELAGAVRAHPNLRLAGLMTMPPWEEDAEKTRPYFRRLREVAESVHRPGERLGLSMGMSHDFEVAIQEGANAYLNRQYRAIAVVRHGW